jgi:putative methyltransferase (TIGR04325 family)
MDQHDYPALYWVSRSLREGMQSVFDVGGATGIKFFAFHDELALWPQVSWTVQDVPAMVAKGRAIVAATDPAPPLHFTDRFEDGNGADLLFASGVLQYLPNTLAELMSGFTKFPKRIVINTAAIHASHEYFTVNSIGTAFCPYRVQTQAGVVRSLGKLGYRLREAWSNPDKPLTIPGRPTHSLQNYAGFVFDLLPKS